MLLGVPAPEPDPEVPPDAEPDPLPLMLPLEPLGLLLELLELPGAVVAPGLVELPGLVGLDDGEADFDDEPDDDPVVLSGLRSHAATANAAATAAARVRY
ncbi:MAG TPA: hypothetical protein VMN03_13050 [Burkholderiales bacterium]|nr:hypothetical protein [Burkholderiales bacterium]